MKTCLVDDKDDDDDDMTMMMITFTEGFCTSGLYIAFIYFISFYMDYIVNVLEPLRYIGEALLLLPLFR